MLLHSNFLRRCVRASAVASVLICLLANAEPVLKSVLPSVTDARIHIDDFPHYVLYEPNREDDILMLFLPGTGGHPKTMPFADVALKKGYRVISLSYITDQAVAQICIYGALKHDAGCAEKFREKRVYGRDVTPLIPDQSYDAIVPRLTALLNYLAANDAGGKWATYLSNGKPNWQRIAVSGQSQGGGMAAFIAQREPVARVITFSGGWDYSAPNKIAYWYAGASVTPPAKWFGTYNVEEPEAKVIAETYTALRIPANHQFALDKPVRAGKKAHGEGIGNLAYHEIWEAMLTQ
jgi:dienelactone hydrolase